ncbi:DUF1273 domain-containing protein [Fructobacillus ficulneus]|uniref:UPF0398 protein FFIC_285600 n=1 Tax=Fructobacillus ficulneus TaxID=157463 RepID=A0A0K8MJ23_9LACO|nr:DUF1273 domain-containing protein [Fructobacillus ficulneus]GAP00541.1 hypothetical protein FFIC_285600 [Fructobacillus ficulneus]
MSRIWITGYRTYELGVFKDTDPKVQVLKYAIKKTLMEQIDQGLEWVLTGGQLGVETWTVEVALELKQDYPELHVALFLPFGHFGSQWKESSQAKLADLKTKVDFYADVHKEDYQSPHQLRQYQDFLLNHSDGAVMVYDVDYPGKAQYDYQAIEDFRTQRPYPLQIVTMDDLQEFASDYQEALNEDLD